MHTVLMVLMVLKKTKNDIRSVGLSLFHSSQPLSFHASLAIRKREKKRAACWLPEPDPDPDPIPMIPQFKSPLSHASETINKKRERKQRRFPNPKAIPLRIPPRKRRIFYAMVRTYRSNNNERSSPPNGKALADAREDLPKRPRLGGSRSSVLQLVLVQHDGFVSGEVICSPRAKALTSLIHFGRENHKILQVLRFFFFLLGAVNMPPAAALFPLP